MEEGNIVKWGKYWTYFEAANLSPLEDAILVCYYIYIFFFTLEISEVDLYLGGKETK